MMMANISPRTAVITTSWDDGDHLDMKLADLLSKYSLTATFYLPVNNVERPSLSLNGIETLAQYFDIGGHTMHHVDLTKIGVEQAAQEVIQGKLGLESIIHRQIASFCYPMGKYNSHIKKIVKEAGFAGARTLQACTRKISDPFQMSSTVHARNYIPVHYLKHAAQSMDAPLFQFMIKRNLYFKTWDRIAIELLHFVVRNGGIWHLCGHSWEIESNNDWSALDSVFKEIQTISEGALKVDNTVLLRHLSVLSRPVSGVATAR
jgi:peptidoglycan-N-acetylglucosamine deacetylase